MRIECKRSDCKYQWEYGGQGKFYACCPMCLGRVRLAPKKKNRKNVDTN